MHFLMEWGLTPQQEQELRAKLKARYRAELVGAVPMRRSSEGGSFQIVSATLSDKGMATALVTSGQGAAAAGRQARRRRRG